MTDIFTHTPDWRGGVTETLEWLTDVQTTRTGKESRRRLRRDPRRSMTFEVVSIGDDLRRLDGDLFRVGPGPWLMPLWWDVCAGAVLGLVGVGDISVSAPGIGLHRDWQVGQPGVVRRGGEWVSFDVIEVTDDMITGTPHGSPALTSGTVRAYPAWEAMVTRQVELARQTAGVARTTITAEFVDYISPDGISLDDQYLGDDLWLDQPNRSTDVNVEYARDLERIDRELGPWRLYSPSGRPFPLRRQLHTYHDRATLWDRRRWWQSLGGRHTRFWSPTYQADMRLVQALPDFADIIIDQIDWTDTYSGDAFRSHFAIRTAGAATLVREVESAMLIGGGFESLEFPGQDSIPSGYPVDRIRQLCWCEPVRLASDSITIQWISAGVANVSLGVRAIDDDQ